MKESGRDTGICQTYHLGDHWEPYIIGEPPGEDPWNFASAEVTVNGMMVPWISRLSNNGYQVVEGSGAYFYAERDPKTLEITRWQGHMVRAGELIHVLRTTPHFFFSLGGKPLKLTFMGVKMSATFGDREVVPLSELAKPWMLTLYANVLGYEGDTCSVLGQEGTPFDIHNANAIFGIDADAAPGTVVKFVIPFPIPHPEGPPTGSQTENPVHYDGPMPPPNPHTDE